MASVKKSVIVLGALASLLLVLDVAALVFTLDVLSNTVKTTGVVTGVRTIPTGTRSAYRVENTIQFTAGDGKAYAFIEAGGGLKVGDRVGVGYDRRDPQSATSGTLSTWLTNIILTAWALVAAIAAGARYAA